MASPGTPKITVIGSTEVEHPPMGMQTTDLKYTFSLELPGGIESDMVTTSLNRGLSSPHDKIKIIASNWGLTNDTSCSYKWQIEFVKGDINLDTSTISAELAPSGLYIMKVSRLPGPFYSY